jgi:hypothetical protein
VADELTKLSTDIQNLATAAPGDIASAAGKIQTEISDLKTSLACPASSP